MDDDDVAVHLRKEKEERKADVLKKLELQKIRFLLAFEKQVSKNPQNTTNPKTGINLHGTAEILNSNEYFNIAQYLRCAKAICNVLCDLPKSYKNPLDVEDIVFTYILRHAQLFGNQSHNMFPVESQGKLLLKKSEYEPPTPRARSKPHVSEYVKKITALIEYLKSRYDKMKYRILNANLTYITLLILRIRVQDSGKFLNSFQHDNTQNDYRKLCPHPFSCGLPRINQQVCSRLRDDNLDEPVNLATYAFFTVKDDLTKMILQKTCMQYFEWYRMDLPGLFFKVVSLYGIPEARLWDVMSAEKTSESLYRLADVYNTDVSPEIVPYRMVLDREPYIERPFLDCTWESNVYLCTILTHLVDEKNGFDEYFIRNSDWVKYSAANKAAMKIAKLFQQFYTQ